MTTRHARCSCGQLKVEVTGDPIRISVCHCLACQLRTGSAFGAQARFPRGDARIEGHSTAYVRTADSGQRITYHFCPQCGSIVHYHLEQLPEVIAVPIGAFADPGFPPPRISIYESRRHPWAEISAQVEHCD
jgi:hypothetical protein